MKHGYRTGSTVRSKNLTIQEVARNQSILEYRFERTLSALIELPQCLYPLENPVVFPRNPTISRFTPMACSLPRLWPPAWCGNLTQTPGVATEKLEKW